MEVRKICPPKKAGEHEDMNVKSVKQVNTTKRDKKEEKKKENVRTDKLKQMAGQDVYDMILPSLSEASSLSQRRERGAQQNS